MLFNSIEFLLFLPAVFIIYWFILKNQLKLQNTFLIVASYFFYGWWDWRFLSLIIISSATDYLAGIFIYRSQKTSERRLFLLLSIGVNLGFLGFFKYFNFFVDSFIDAFQIFGMHLNKRSLDIILPVGISFYTFQTLSYTIDIYRKKITPTKDILAFFAFVSFFPQLVAGPIERAGNLVPQFLKERTFDYDKAVDGMRQILWGFFKKMVIADNCAMHVNEIFANWENHSGATLILGAVLFAFQIYGDFSGYSDIAIGTARLFGFNLMRNFAFPYFSRDIAEFWRRWHISLSTWFRDYVYIPLGGSKVSVVKQIRNVLVIFMVSGFWHGANWTYVVWGVLNALFFIPLLIRKKNRKYLDVPAKGRFVPNIREILQIGSTFMLTCFGWIFFRAENMTQAMKYIGRLFSTLTVNPGEVLQVVEKNLFIPLIFMIILEWIQREKQHALAIEKLPVWVRYPVYFIMLFSILLLGNYNKVEFIYFAF